MKKKLVSEMIDLMEQHINNQSNSIYMGGKVKLIDALNETNVIYTTNSSIYRIKSNH